MEIDITSLLETSQFELSHSVMEGGANAGPQTWKNALERAEETALLDTPEKLEAMRDFAREAGAWGDEEIAAWSETEVNALFLQWIAGDVRECPAKLEGVDYTEENGEWTYTDDGGVSGDYYGPFESRSECYHNHIAGERQPRAESLDEIDWDEYSVQAEAGRISGRLIASGQSVFYYLGN